MKKNKKLKKPIIWIDENDNQANWKKYLWRIVWKDVYIPKDLRDKFKIVFDDKTNTIKLKRKKKK